MQNLGGAEHTLQLRGVCGGTVLHHVNLFVETRVINADVEHETVELRFGERISPFLFNRILRGQNKKGQIEIIGPSPSRDPVFLHGLQQGRLRFRWSAVDFVGQHNIGKDRTLQKPIVAMPCLLVFFQDIGARDVRWHEIRCKLDTVEAQVEHICQCADK